MIKQNPARADPPAASRLQPTSQPENKLLMQPRALYTLAATALLASLWVSGCARPAASEALRHYAAPLPAVPPPTEAEIDTPPELSSSQPSLERYSRFLAQQAAREQAEALAATARQHLQEGKRMFERGDRDKGRAEFNMAVQLLLDVPEDHLQRGIVEHALQTILDDVQSYDILTSAPGLTGGTSAAGDSDDVPEGVEAITQAAAQMDSLDLTFPVDPHLEDRVFDLLDASSSQLPLDVNEEVMHYITFFTTTRGSRVVKNGLHRPARYKQMIYRIFDEEGVPRELVYLAQAESGFNPRAVSPKRATGMWQFVQWRGQEYGLSQDKYREDRFNPELATRAEARHLRDLYKRFGDWLLVLAAYNWGPEAIDRAVERTGYADFWYLHRTGNIPKETANHIPIIIAMAIIAKNPAAFGIELGELPGPMEFDEVLIKQITSLQLIADLAGVTVADLTNLNPALLQNVAPENYLLRVPRSTGLAVAAGLSRIPAEGRTLWRAHRVTPGDSLLRIAQLYKIKPETIAAANSTNAEELRSGDLLLVPMNP